MSSDLGQLMLLTLDGTKITDDGVPKLSNLSGLRFLSLEETEITDAGVQELRLALPNCNIQTTKKIAERHDNLGRAAVKRRPRETCEPADYKSV